MHFIQAVYVVSRDQITKLIRISVLLSKLCVKRYVMKRENWWFQPRLLHVIEINEPRNYNYDSQVHCRLAVVQETALLYIQLGTAVLLKSIQNGLHSKYF